MIRLAAALVLSALTGSAAAQEAVPGVYDGSAVDGWAYDAQASAELGLPTWLQSGIAAENRVSNCNITTVELAASRAEYDQYFSATTPHSFAAQMAESGTVVTHAYLTAVFDMDGRPVMRNLLTTDHEGSPVDMVSTIIGGADHMVTITCGVPGGALMGYLQPFQDFLEGVRIETQRPR